MCVVSMITEHYRDRWEDRIPKYPQPGNIPGGTIPGWPTYPSNTPAPPNDPIDIEAIKKIFGPKEPAITQEEIAEFRALLARAREYDKRNNEPACEMREKQDALIAVAKALGVTITIEELNA